MNKFSRLIMAIFVWGYIVTVAIFVLAICPKVPSKLKRKLRALQTLQKFVMKNFKTSPWECITAAIQAFCLLLGLFAPFFGCVLAPDTANLFLSIHATTLTMHIAFLALFSGVLQESYMKVSYADFFLNLKPRLYKQKRTILVSLICLSASCVCYVCEAYTMNAAFLACEMLFIAVSIHFMYGVFADKEKIKWEILDYMLKKQFENDPK